MYLLTKLLVLIVFASPVLSSEEETKQNYPVSICKRDVNRYLMMVDAGDKRAKNIAAEIIKRISQSGNANDIEYIRQYSLLLKMNYEQDVYINNLYRLYPLLMDNYEFWHEDEDVYSYIADTIAETIHQRAVMAAVYDCVPPGSTIKRYTLITAVEEVDLSDENQTSCIITMLPRGNEYPSDESLSILDACWKVFVQRGNRDLAQQVMQSILSLDPPLEYVFFHDGVQANDVQNGLAVAREWLGKSEEERWQQLREWYADLHRRILDCPDSEKLEELDKELLAYYHEGERRWQAGRTTTDAVFARATLWNDDELFAGGMSIFKKRMQNWHQAESWKELVVMLCETKLAIDEFAETMIPELSEERRQIRKDKLLLGRTKEVMDDYVEFTETPVDPEQWTPDQAQAMAQHAMSEIQLRGKSRLVVEYCERIIAQAKQRLSDLGESTEIEAPVWEPIVVRDDVVDMTWTPPEGLSDFELLEHQEEFFRRKKQLLAEREAARNEETDENEPGDDDPASAEDQDQPSPERNPVQEGPQDEREPSSLQGEEQGPLESRDGTSGIAYWLAGGICGLVLLIGGGWLAVRRRGR